MAELAEKTGRRAGENRTAGAGSRVADAGGRRAGGDQPADGAERRRAGGALSIRGLHVERGTFALDVDELDIRGGEVFAILGRTGSGKTVLLETVAGAFEPQRGRVELDGVDLRRVPVRERGLGVVYQDQALFPHMTVARNIGYGLRMRRLPADEVDRRVGEMLELFGIAHIADKRPGVISGGEAQRTALARALVLEPEVLLLDEPFSALDPTTKESMYATVEKVHRRFGSTIVFVTHDFHEAMRLADRVGVVLGGRLRTVVPADELFARDHDADVREFLGIAENRPGADG